MHRIGTLALALLLSGWCASSSLAQATRPALEAIDRDIRALYASTQQRIVRVNVPVQLSNQLLDQQHPLSKLAPQMDPKLRERLAAPARGPNSSGPVLVDATRAATQASQPLSATMNVEFLGLVLDRQGRVLVPIYIDPAYVQAPLKVSVDDQAATTAKVVASDRLTSLTVLELAQPAGEPVSFAKGKPQAGTIMLVLAPAGRAAQLSVWSGRANENGILIDADGQVSAIVRNKHALFPFMFTAVLEQLIRGEPVKRAQLGVVIVEIGPDHPARAQVPALGARPAAQVREVMKDSPAAKAGVQQEDVILAINDEPVEDVTTFAAAVASFRGATTLRILRNGEPQTLTVDLQPR